MAGSLGLTVSFYKTKFMVGGSSVSMDESQPPAVGYGLIKWVDHFPYLGSVIAADGGINADIDKRIANASKGFGSLCKSVFTHHQLSIKLSTMCIRLVYYPSSFEEIG